jgi:hypothetical protein
VPYEGASRGAGDYFLHEYPNPMDVTGSYSPSNPALADLKRWFDRHVPIEARA